MLPGVEDFIKSQSTNESVDHSKYVLVATFPTSHKDIIIKEINDRFDELTERELIEDVAPVENEYTMEVVFFSDNASVTEKSILNSFNDIHEKVQLRVFKESISTLDKEGSEEEISEEEIMIDESRSFRAGDLVGIMKPKEYKGRKGNIIDSKVEHTVELYNEDGTISDDPDVITVSDSDIYNAR